MRIDPTAFTDDLQNERAGALLPHHVEQPLDRPDRRARQWAEREDEHERIALDEARAE